MTDANSDDDADTEPAGGGADPERDSGVDAAFEPDPERVALLREVAADVRGETGERKQLANVLYRVSDLYDPDEETSPEEIVRNVKFILEVNERGGLGR